MTTLIQSPDDVPQDAVVPAKADSGSASVYHTHEDCKHLRDSSGTRPLTWDDARTTIRECNYCQTASFPTLAGLPNDAVVSGSISPLQLSVYHTTEDCSVYPSNPRDPADVSAMGELRECDLCKRQD